MAQYTNNRQNGNTFNKLASTVYDVGDFLIFNGAGQVVPATGGVALVGISNEKVQAIDLDYAVTRPIHMSESVPNDEIFSEVTGGPVTEAMVGSPYDVDPASPDKIDVSGAGTDFLITNVVGSIVNGFQFLYTPIALVFVNGETVTSATGSATVVTDTAGVSMVITTLSGVFSPTQVITGGTSGATATLTAVNPTYESVLGKIVQ